MHTMLHTPRNSLYSRYDPLSKGRVRFLSELHSNPFIFPFEQCYPRQSPATYIRCCSAHWRKQLPNRDCP